MDPRPYVPLDDVIDLNLDLAESIRLHDDATWSRSDSKEEKHGTQKR